MYSDHYGLTEQPFQLTPDARYWFSSATHRKAMAYLGYGLAQGEGFIVVTGDVGAGKTTLVGHLMATIDEQRLTAVKLVSTQVGADDMLRLAAQSFGIPVAGASKAQLLDRFDRFLLDQARAAKRTLLIVDEAQTLAPDALEELRMLSNFQSGGQALLQIFLLGQPEFRDRLAGEGLEQLRQRVIATHHLEPMGQDELGPYLRHRLAQAGWTGRPEFTDEAIARLHAETGGVPRRVNLLVSRVLLQGAMQETDTIDGALVEAVVADLAVDQHVAPQPQAPTAAARAGTVTSLRTDAELLRRIEALEHLVDEQDRAIRRVLTLLIDWVERDEAETYQRHSAA